MKIVKYSFQIICVRAHPPIALYRNKILSLLKFTWVHRAPINYFNVFFTSQTLNLSQYFIHSISQSILFILWTYHVIATEHNMHNQIRHTCLHYWTAFGTRCDMSWRVARYVFTGMRSVHGNAFPFACNIRKYCYVFLSNKNRASRN